MAKKNKRKDDGPIKNLVIISDTHAGCQEALCPPGPVNLTLDHGGSYTPSENQLRLWALWKELWDPKDGWVTQYTQDEPFDLIHNAEQVDGVHHNSVTQITHNLVIQARIAKANMELPLSHPRCRNFYQIRGTEAHTGKSGQAEEALAESLGAVPELLGHHRRYSRYELWKNVGKGLVHIMHHIGTTSASAYESTAVYKELVEEFVEAARWGERPPDIIVRSHRHRAFGIIVPAELATNEAWSVVTPGWQNKTPFAFKIAGARISMPQFGAVIIRVHGDDAIRPGFKVWTASRPTPE